MEIGGKNMNVKLVKLVTGEELIAEVEHKQPVFELKNPIRLILSEKGVGMAPFSPFLDGDPVKIEIKEEHVICTGNVDIEVVNAYNQQFGSGIVLATPTLKLKE